MQGGAPRRNTEEEQEQGMSRPPPSPHHTHSQEPTCLDGIDNWWPCLTWSRPCLFISCLSTCFLMSNITPYFANNWISKLNKYENGGWLLLWAMTGVEADLLPSPGHRSCRFRTLVMLQELNIVCWQLWGVRRLGTRWQLIVAGVRSGELCCALQPHEIFALDSLAAPRAPRCPALRHSINISRQEIFLIPFLCAGMIALLLAVTWTHEIQIDTW